jgi:hypothetical protein
MTLKWATVVPGSEVSASAGTTGAIRCVLSIPGESLTRAVLKRGHESHTMAEAFCALLLRGWGLPVPRPFLVQEGPLISFASADDGYPNLNQRLGVDALPKESSQHAQAVKIAAQLACSLPTAALAATADEAIQNRDRNLGNILWNGTDEAWIDHAFALGNGAHLPDANKLCDMAVFTGQAEALEATAIAHWTALDRAEPLAAARSLESIADCTSSAAFVAARLNQLGMLLLARFPSPRDLLSPT